MSTPERSSESTFDRNIDFGNQDSSSAPKTSDEEPSLLQAVVGDGTSLLAVTGLCLMLSGGFALFLATTGQFLPHDVKYLGFEAERLCALNACRIVHFMMHDRASFGGALISIGTLYIWLATFPLRQAQSWAWWTFLITGVCGFGSFLAYLGYGYLDGWHGVATCLLLPVFILGLWRSRQAIGAAPLRCILRPARKFQWRNEFKSTFGRGRLLLLATAFGMIFGGATILMVGITSVFVPQDLAYMNVSPEYLRSLSPRLVPLIAHDRAGFGGAIFTTGLCVAFCVWCGKPSRLLCEVLAVAGAAGFGAAIGVHPWIGYTDPLHLAPAILGAVFFILGLACWFQPLCKRKGTQAAATEGVLSEVS